MGRFEEIKERTGRISRKWYEQIMNDWTEEDKEGGEVPISQRLIYAAVSFSFRSWKLFGHGSDLQLRFSIDPQRTWIMLTRWQIVSLEHTHTHMCHNLGALVTSMLPYVCVCVCMDTPPSFKPVRLCECPDYDMLRLCVTSHPWVSEKENSAFLKLCAEQRADVRINTVHQ